MSKDGCGRSEYLTLSRKISRVDPCRCIRPLASRGPIVYVNNIMKEGRTVPDRLRRIFANPFHDVNHELILIQRGQIVGGTSAYFRFWGNFGAFIRGGLTIAGI
jgi:hypothetical protein